MKIGVAVVGAGYWGPNLARAINAVSDAELRWLIDRDKSRLSDFGGLYEQAARSVDIDDALQDPNVDAVFIATPAGSHYGLVERSLRAKKHVFVEKPFLPSKVGGAELIELADTFSLVLMTGHTFIYNEGVKMAKGLMTAPEFGKLKHLQMTRTNLGMLRPDVNVGWDLASHDISIANWLLNGRPEKVSAVSGTWINQGIADTMSINLTYPDGIKVNIYASWLSPEKVRKFVAVGAKQMLTVDDTQHETPITIFNKGVARERSLVGEEALRLSYTFGETEIPSFKWKEPLMQECMHFFECVRSSVTPETSGIFGLDVVCVLEAIDESALKGGAETGVDYGE